uniref:hypothetical protein n=1 Tax=uncultured Caulobacter sp. TaxID=158749 RepID=UPI0025D3C7AA|nr:hypothetical protein [uncultured Caulobacter sp.]
MSDDPEPKAPKRLRPTIIAAPAKRVKPMAATMPTVIPGVARKRIAVRSADMARLCPGVASHTAARAVRFVDGFVVEDARERHVVEWGQATQERAAALLDAPEFSLADVPDQARGYVGRIAAVLAALDIDTPRRRAATRAELEKLLCLTQAVLGTLRDFQTALDDQARRFSEVSLEIEAAALAALFLSEHLAPLRPELSRDFLRREMSLTQTALAIRGGQFERDSQLQHTRALVATIQDVVLVSLPDCLAALGRARSRLNPTEAGELEHSFRAIVRKLDA